MASRLESNDGFGFRRNDGTIAGMLERGNTSLDSTILST
jgi:hypothetical protein